MISGIRRDARVQPAVFAFFGFSGADLLGPLNVQLVFLLHGNEIYFSMAAALFAEYPSTL